MKEARKAQAGRDLCPSLAAGLTQRLEVNCLLPTLLRHRPFDILRPDSLTQHEITAGSVKSPEPLCFV